MRPLLTPALALAALVAATLAPRLVGAVVASPQQPEVTPTPVAPEPPPSADSPTLTVALDRDAVTPGGLVRAQLVLHAPTSDTEAAGLPTDVVVVIDRSGSMAGDKIYDARRAAQELLGLLGPEDRASIISFSDHARVDLPLRPVDGRSFEAIASLGAAGGTEMQAGLDLALGVLQGPQQGRARRVLLLSDGQPNRRDGLLEQAARAASAETPLTAVGIGADYDVQLMQSLADAGTGNFYWARADLPLGQVFADEFRASRAAVTASTQLQLQGHGASVVDWGGLPSTEQQVSLGQLFSGQRRSMWVTLRVDPTTRPGESVTLGDLHLAWTGLDGTEGQTVASLGSVDVVADEALAAASLNADQWADAVVDDEYNVVLGQVSRDLAQGDKAAAVQKLQHYQQRNERLNAQVKSHKVHDNLAEVERLQQQIDRDQVGKLGLLDLATQAWSGRRKGQTWSSMPAPAPR